MKSTIALLTAGWVGFGGWGGRAIAQPLPALPELPPLPNTVTLPCLTRPYSIVPPPTFVGVPFSPTIADRPLSNIAVQYAALGQADRAVEVWDQIQDERVKGYILFNIANAVLAGGDRDRAVELLERAVQLAETLDSQPVLLGQIATSFAAAGEVERAMQLARRQTEPWRRDRAIANIIVKLAESGKLSEAIELARRTPEANNSAWQGIVRKAIAIGEYRQGIAIAESLDDRCDRAEALQQATTALLLAEQVGLAIEVAQGIEEAKVRVKALTAIAAQLLRDERPEDAVEILDLALAATPTLSPRQQADTLTEIASYLIQAGQTEEAELLLARALELAQSPSNTYISPVPSPP